MDEDEQLSAPVLRFVHSEEAIIHIEELEFSLKALKEKTETLRQRNIHFWDLPENYCDDDDEEKEALLSARKVANFERYYSLLGEIALFSSLLPRY